MSEQPGVAPKWAPRPVPMNWHVDLHEALADGKPVNLVQITAEHVTGLFIGYIEADAAIQLGGIVRKLGKQAKSGLIETVTPLWRPGS